MQCPHTIECAADRLSYTSLSCAVTCVTSPPSLLPQVTGYCAWPGLMWSLDLCARFSWPEVISTFEKGVHTDKGDLRLILASRQGTQKPTRQQPVAAGLVNPTLQRVCVVPALQTRCWCASTGTTAAAGLRPSSCWPGTRLRPSTRARHSPHGARRTASACKGFCLASCRPFIWDTHKQSSSTTVAVTQWVPVVVAVLRHRLRLVGATLDELSARSDDPDEEVSRMDRLGRQYQLDFLQATARHRHSSLLRPHNSEQASAAAAGGGTASVAAASAAAAAAAAAAGGDDLPVTGNAWGTCDVCRCGWPAAGVAQPANNCGDLSFPDVTLYSLCPP